jgi:hypothetical protein
MVGKKKILAESFREMVWSELERKLTEEPAEQEGILFTEGVSEEGSDGLPDLGSIPPESFTERSLGTPKKESKDELIGLVRGLNGDSIGEKLTSLSGYLAHPPAPQTAGDVSNFILYVNTVKTLTSILTDFSPSSSGFLYEAFLAACVNGEQISGREIILDGEKLTNIADIKINGGFYGVKLNKNGVVSGSFRNLMATLLEHDSITYLTSLKKITGEGLEIEGTVTTYEIPITSDNIIQLLTSASNPTNVSSMRTPQASFLEQLGDALDDPAAVVRAIQNTFQENNPKDADTIIWGDKGNTENVLKTFDLKNLKTTYGWQKGGKFKFNKTQVIGLAEQGAPIELKIGKKAIVENIKNYLEKTESGFAKILSQAMQVLEKLSSLTDKTHDYATNGFEASTGGQALQLSKEMASETTDLINLVTESSSGSP